VLIIAGEHEAVLNPKFTEFSDGFFCIFADGILEENASGIGSVNGDIKVRAVFFRKDNFLVLKKLFVSADDSFSLCSDPDTFACGFGSFFSGRDFDTFFFRFCKNAFCYWVIGKRFCRSGIAKDFIFGIFFCGFYFRNTENTGGEGSGFIKNRVFDFRKAFAIFRTFDDNSVFGCGTDSRKIRKRNRKNKSAGTA
jgi:hypothetical protein